MREKRSNAHRAMNPVEKVGRQIDVGLWNAAKSIKKGSIGPNPTASGSGGQVAINTGNERANHKYIKKVQTKSGKVRYIYDMAENLTSSNNAAKSKAMTNYNIKRASDQSIKRNTGRPESMKGPVYKATTTVRDLANSAGRTINDGVNFVKNLFK